MNFAYTKSGQAEGEVDDEGVGDVRPTGKLLAAIKVPITYYSRGNLQVRTTQRYMCRDCYARAG